MIDPAVIAARVRNARRLAEMSQAETAWASKVTQPLISQLESGAHRNPTIATVNRLAAALHTTPGYLLGLTEEIAP